MLKDIVNKIQDECEEVTITAHEIYIRLLPLLNKLSPAERRILEVLIETMPAEGKG